MKGAGCSWVCLTAFLLLVPHRAPTNTHQGFTCALESAVEDSDDPWADPQSIPVTTISEPIASSIEQPLVDEAATEGVQKARPQTIWKPLTARNFVMEMCILAFCAVYIANIFRGRHLNAKLAKAWAREFCLPEGIFHKNFALVGVGEGKPPLQKMSASEFKLYCSGRRHCKFLEATLKLKTRQDLLSLLLGALFPQDDHVDVEVYMKESSMPQLVLAVATKKLMKTMLKEEGGGDDVRKLTRKLEVTRDKLPSWPSDKLVVHTEHSSLFYDIMSEGIVEQVFGQAAFEAQGRYFRLLHFTSEQAYGDKDQRAMLRFSFRLPPEGDMQQLTRLLSAVGVFVDIVGNYKLTPDQRKRAEKVRQEVEKKEAKEKGKEASESVEERRMAKRAEELEKMRRMTPEQREKYEARKAKVEEKRNQKKFVKRG